jgi:hypothetical protein
MRIALALLPVLLLAACQAGSGPELEPAAADHQPPAAAALPALASLPLPPRAARDVTTYTFLDSDLMNSTAATMTGSDLTLDAAGLSWAILGTTVPPGRVPSMLHLTGSSDGVYIGVSDFNHMTWRWLAGPQTGDHSFGLFNPDSMAADGSFYVLAACADGDAADIELSVDLSDERWNVMIWIAGDNNLAQDAVDDLNEMEQVGSNEQLTLLAGFDIDPEWTAGGISGIDQVRFIKVVEDSDPLAINVGGDPANLSLPRAGYDSSDPDNLATFIDWCDLNFPDATRQMLILWNHGDGWLEGDPSQALGGGGRHASGVLSDDTDGGEYVTPNIDVTAGLAGRHFDYLCFDACNMGHLEAQYQYAALADSLVASQILVPGGGYPYDLWLGDWAQSFPIPYDAIGALLCDRFTNYWDSPPPPVTDDDGCLTMLEAEAVGNLTDALAALAAEVTPKGAQESEHVKAAITGAYQYWLADGVRDLGDFLTAYRAGTADATIQGLLDAALAAYAAAISHHSVTVSVDATGLAIFLPDQTGLDYYKEHYRGTPFNQATSWLEMLEATGVPEGGSGGEWPVAHLWQLGERVVFRWDSNPDRQIMLYITDGWAEGWPGNPDELDGIINFSPDSPDSGECVEWAELLPGAPGGYYQCIMMNLDVARGRDVTIYVTIEDSEETVLRDLGSINMWTGETDLIDLIYDDGSVNLATWEPGDYIKISWGSTNADFDLMMIDPDYNIGFPGAPEMLEGIIEFSEDSIISGMPEEWGELLDGGSVGLYQAWIDYLSYDGMPPESAPVNVVLYAGDDSVKEDFGFVMFDGEFDIGETKLGAFLIYEP